MGDAVKWVIIAICGLLAFNWLRNGVSANASMNAQMNPSGWGSGMIYAPGSAWQGPYLLGGQIPAWSFQPPVMVKPYEPPTPISVDYDPDNGISFQYGY